MTLTYGIQSDPKQDLTLMCSWCIWRASSCKLSYVNLCETDDLLGFIKKNLNVLAPSLGVIKFVESTYFVDRETKWLWLFLFVLLRARKLASAHWLPWMTREVSSPTPPSHDVRSGGKGISLILPSKCCSITMLFINFVNKMLYKAKRHWTLVWISTRPDTVFLTCTNSFWRLNLHQMGMTHLRSNICFILMIMFNIKM